MKKLSEAIGHSETIFYKTCIDCEGCHLPIYPHTNFKIFWFIDGVWRAYHNGCFLRQKLTEEKQKEQAAHL
jgi:hypothetical protein